MSSLDYLDLCRLCLVKDRVSVPIFEDEGDVRQIFLKITACLPVKVSREDKLPKKICDDCVYKVELFYQFWNTTANAEKQLLQWLGEVGGLEENQSYVTEVLDSNVMKQERSSDSRLDASVMQVGGHQNNMDMGMIDNMSLITMPTGNEQFTSVPMDTTSAVQTVQAVPGSSTQTTHDQMSQNRTAVTHLVEEEEESEDEENSDDGCDNEEGLPVKEETEEDPSDQPLEPTTFVNVSIPCDEAGPSGLQQQKISEISEMTIPQTADGDSKTGVSDEDEEEADEIKEGLELQELDQLEVFDDDTMSAVATTAAFQSKCTSTPIAVTEVKETNEAMDEDVDENEDDPEATCNAPVTAEPIRSLLVRMDSGVLKRLFQCSQCDQVFASVKHCVRHMSTGHPRSRKYRVAYRCKTCQKLFRTKYGCENHIQGKHKNRTFQCRFCGFKTASMTYIKKHERNHIDDYEIRCDVCGKGFASKTVLERHMISHTGEKPFVCEVCNASYADKRSLQLHATVHDPEGRPKKYTCDICEYSSFWKNAVKTHMKVHTGAKVICDECGQAVASNYYLKIHKRIHSDEKPFTCDICSKGFRQMKNLVVHQRTHTKIKPYKCRNCGKSFSQNVWLKKHKCNPTYLSG